MVSDTSTRLDRPPNDVGTCLGLYVKYMSTHASKVPEPRAFTWPYLQPPSQSHQILKTIDKPGLTLI